MAVQRVLEVLAEPNRRQIMDLLLERPRPVGELVELLELSQPSTSKHLRVLREHALVAAKVVGKQRVYSVRPQPLRELDAWLAPYRRLWADSLDRLERVLDESYPRRGPHEDER